VYANGDLLGIVEDKNLVKLDWNSNVEWDNEGRFHHDVDIVDNGDIYTLARREKIVFCGLMPLPILDDYILLLSSDGRIKKSISIFKLLKNRLSPGTIAKIYSWILRPHTLVDLLLNKKDKHFALEGWFRYPTDVFHTNTVEIINKPIEGVCKKGALLICVRNFNLIGILDVEKEKLVWEWGPGELRMPHHPTLLDNGNILIFDNGWEREYSRLVELNPITKKIVWEYKSDPPQDFFSMKRGANQRLPNGNTLITESDNGRVFEITPEGEKVWEFYSTIVKERTRKAIYRMMRIADEQKYPFLDLLK